MTFVLFDSLASGFFVFFREQSDNEEDVDSERNISDGIIIDDG